MSNDIIELNQLITDADIKEAKLYRSTDRDRR